MQSTSRITMQSITTLAILFAHPLQAQDSPVEEQQEIETGWFTDEHGLSVHYSGIHLPMAFSTVQYNEKRPAQSREDGLDNAIQYGSEDGAVFATFYIYRPALADAVMNSVLTNAAIKSRFSPDAEPDFRSLMPLGGQENGAIILGYNNSELGLATAAGFAKVGQWILKMRVSGPSDRAEEVLQALTQGMAAVKTDPDIPVHPLSLKLPDDCETRLEGKAEQTILDNDKRIQAALVGGAMAILPFDQITQITDKNGNGTEPSGSTDASAALARSYDQWCIAGSYEIENFRYYIYRTSDAPDSIVVAPYGDTGASIVYQPAELEPKGRYLMRYDIGSVENYGIYSGDFNPGQYRNILTGQSSVIGKIISVTNVRADGSTAITVGTP